MVMIRVFVCKENRVNIFELGVCLDGETPWIGQESFSFCFYEQATMSEFGNFHIVI